MGAITVPVTEEGIVVPSAAVQLLGGRVGGWAEVEVRMLPSAEELEDKALYYILHHLGDAVYVGAPVWIGDSWRLSLKVKGVDGVFGQIILTSMGDVIEAATTSRMELREAIRAAHTPDPAAR